MTQDGASENVEVTEQIPTTNETFESATSCEVQDTCPAGMDAEIEHQLKNENISETAVKPTTDFEPRIIAFCCNWCSYAGADLAGVSRLQYPTNVRIIRVLCSGRIKPDFVLRALELGADGVLVAGCHPGDCHYISGNLKAEKRFQMLTKLLEVLGIEPGRARLEWISASEGPKFAGTITEFVDQIKELGPNKLKQK
jgi:F420-non-reducing hydrogenase iron-sulfur subunit